MSTAPRRPDLANEPVGRLMLRLSIPTITAQLVNMLYNIVDRIYISYIPDVGTLALTGLGVCLPIILLVSAFAALCASSGAPLASIAMGQRNNEKAEGILGSCTALLLCVSAVLTVVLSCFYTPILLAFGATEDALPYAQRYIAIYSLGTVFVQLSLGLNPFITAQGFSKAGMLTVLIGAVLNTLLDPLFIFVFHMDVQGAALATVISQAVSAAFVLRFLTGRQTILHLKRRLLRLNWKLLAPCVALGLAPFIMQSTESLVSVCFNTSLRAAGGTLAVGTMTICSTLMQFALLPLQGLSQGAQPIISFNYGAKRPERVKAAFRILLISCLAFSAVLGLTCIFAPQIFVYLLTPDAALREYAIPCVRLYMAGVTIFGAQIACQQTFVALGNAKCSLFLACLRKLILLIPLVYLYILLATAESATDGGGLGKIRELCGWAVRLGVKGLCAVFTAYLSLSRVLTGSADAMAVKAAQAAFSGMVPVVGSILSDASESLLASAGLIRSAAGAFGMLAVLAMALAPFARLGAFYLALRLAGAIGADAVSKAHAGLISNLASAMGYMLAIAASTLWMSLVSSACFLKAVGG